MKFVLIGDRYKQLVLMPQLEKMGHTYTTEIKRIYKYYIVIESDQEKQQEHTRKILENRPDAQIYFYESDDRLFYVNPNGRFAPKFGKRRVRFFTLPAEEMHHYNGPLTLSWRDRHYTMLATGYEKFITSDTDLIINNALPNLTPLIQGVKFNSITARYVTVNEVWRIIAWLRPYCNKIIFETIPFSPVLRKRMLRRSSDLYHYTIDYAAFTRMILSSGLPRELFSLRLLPVPKEMVDEIVIQEHRRNILPLRRGMILDEEVLEWPVE